MKNETKSLFSTSSTLTPLDGRNREKLLPLIENNSDFALNRNRILVEVAYFKKLSSAKVIRKLKTAEIKFLDAMAKNFSDQDYERIMSIEKLTHHDMKAVEEFIKEKLQSTSLADAAPMIHFGLTSDDVNNIAYALMLRDAVGVLKIEIERIQRILGEKSKEYRKIPMLGRTHGQPAVGTTLGKEFFVYYQRLSGEVAILKTLKIKAKLTGNVGNFNAHAFIFPGINWQKFSEELISSFKFEPDLATTQIEPYDGYLQIFDALKRINYLLKGLCVDFWLYISFGYFKQKIVKEEVGSTALPHKVNPIYFEGAEGGFGLANALLEFYSQKLSHSRLQRDLSDSIVKRSFGIAFGYSLLSYQSVIEALNRITPREERLREELNCHWEILSEAFQNFLRLKNYDDAYNRTKIFFRGKVSGKPEVEKFIKSLHLAKDDEMKLLNLTPVSYVGLAEKIVENI